MRFLVDNSVSWRVARDLRDAGHEATHVGTLGLSEVDDPVVYQRAVTETAILVTQDADFDAIHSLAAQRTGVVLLRLSDGRPRTQAEILLSNLSQVEGILMAGGFIIVEDGGIAVVDDGGQSGI